MCHPILVSTATVPVPNSISRLSSRRGFPVVFLALVLGVFALSPTVLAVDPPPDGGYSNENTAEGDGALFSLTTGADNTANGLQALYSNTTGSENTATGVNALFFNTANDNTATGFEALYSNTTGADDTANGVNALLSNTTGSQNTANGVGTLKQNTTGHANTANGYRALYINTTGRANTANGLQSLYSNTTGSQNTAEGLNALANNTIGSNNLALGVSAGLNLTTGSNNIDIGASGVAGESGVIRIGKSPTATATFIAGIAGKTVASGVGVIVNASGQLGTILSSARYKEAIKPMDKMSETILALKPVTFRYKEDLDPDGVPQFGLIAEQVEKVNPDLVVRDEHGQVMTVRYEAVNAMLLNEFLKEHRQVEELKGTVAQQQKQIEALTAAVRKVSDQLALSKPAPQLVTNP
jgi:Chaperone of endosialidase